MFARNNEKIIGKAIVDAIRNGYHPAKSVETIENIDVFGNGEDVIFTLRNADGRVRRPHYQLEKIIFDPDFAKARWGCKVIDVATIYPKDYVKTAEKNGFTTSIDLKYFNPIRKTFRWQYHLRELVVAHNWFAYLQTHR